MKKIYLLLFAITCGVNVSLAQSTSLSVTNVNNGMALVNNNGSIYLTTTSGQQLSTEVDARNTTTTTKYYKLRRFDDVLNTGASAYFCVGGSNCYTPTTYTSPITMTLTPNQTLASQSLALLLDLEEGLAVGLSSVRYQIYNINDATDYFTLTLRYNDNTGASLNEKTSFFTSVSEVYPSPSADKAFLKVSVPYDGANSNLKIINSLGAVVLSKQWDLFSGTNTIPLELENLSNGLYFISLTNKNNAVTRRIIINK